MDNKWIVIIEYKDGITRRFELESDEVINPHDGLIEFSYISELYPYGIGLDRIPNGSHKTNKILIPMLNIEWIKLIKD